MNIELVIQELLYKKNFITIPGFGSLVSKYQAARIVKSEHVKFIPPCKTIEFNPLLNNDDSTLTTILCEEYKLSYTDAVQEIEAFVNQSRAILESKNKLTIEGIGTFFYDIQKTILLEPSKTPNYLTNTYGLAEFSIHALPRENTIEEYISKQAEKATPLHKKIIKTAFIASPIILGAILIPNILHTPQLAGLISIFRDTHIEVDFTIPPKPQPTNLAQFDSRNQNFSESSIVDTQHVLTNHDEQKKEKIDYVEPKSETITKPIIAENPTPKAIESTNHSFFIIVGSFSTIRTAEKLSLRLQKNSHKAGILSADNKIRVYISSFSSHSDATVALLDLKKNTDYASAWLYVKKA